MQGLQWTWLLTFDNVSQTCQIIIVRSVTNAGLLLYVSHNMVNNVIESYGKYNNHDIKNIDWALQSLKWSVDTYKMLIHQFNMLRSIKQTNINIWIKISNIKITLIKSKNGQYWCVDRYLNLESFCRMMLSFSSSLLSWLGALSTMAIVLNHVSVLHVSRNGCWNGESVDIWRNMSIADPMKVCQWMK